MEMLTGKFPGLFQGIGKAKVPPVHFKVKENAKPVTQKLRPVPANLLPKLKENLDNFVKEGILEGPLGPEHGTGWLYNVVITTKRWDPSKIRVTLDTRALNKVLEKGEYPIPSAEQLRHSFGDSDRFSTIDCNHAFFQFEMDAETQELFYSITPFGIYKWKRMVMGAPPASGECHSNMGVIIQGLQGVVQIKDDLVVHGKGVEHDKNLEAVFARLNKYGITLRKEKCSLGQPEVSWFGHIFNSKGMAADPEKVETVKKWPVPSDKSEIKSFLQTAQFMVPFMTSRTKGQTYSDTTAPLRRLTGKNVHFRWGHQEQVAFNAVKDMLIGDLVLAHYDSKKKTRLYVDHGPSGLGAVLAQWHEQPKESKGHWRPVLHTSRALSGPEKNYGKTEGESLAIYSGITRNKSYLYGTDFEVITDHMPLVSLYNFPTRPAPTRVERHRGKLRQFSFSVKYEPGQTSPADYSSRHPNTVNEKDDAGIETEADEETILINRVEEISDNTAVPLAHIRRQYKKDELLNKLLADVTAGRPSPAIKASAYAKVFPELSIVNGILVRGERVLIPPFFIPRVIAAAHEGHLGIEKTIQNVRGKSWFPALSKLCKEFVETCHPGCSSAVKRVSPPTIQETEEANGPWQICHADYKGPIGGTGGYYFHVLVDQYSKWPEIAVTKSTKFEKLLPVLERSFATHGVPEKIVHDNGPPYSSAAWSAFASSSGFTSQACTPEHPQSNGLAEKMMASIAKLVHASLAENKDPKLEIHRFLMNYRNTPHPSTGHTPSRLLMGRIIKTKIPTLIPDASGDVHEEVKRRIRHSKRRAKQYADKRRRAKDRDVQVGDRVLIAQDKSTVKQPFDPNPYSVTKVSFSQVTAVRGGRKRVRNLGKCKVIRERPHYLQDVRTTTESPGYDSQSELSDFDLVYDDAEVSDNVAVLEQQREVLEVPLNVIPLAAEINGFQVAEDQIENQVDVSDDQFSVVAEDQGENLLEVSDDQFSVVGDQEEENQGGGGRVRRQCRKPDRLGDWTYEEEEGSE